MFTGFIPNNSDPMMRLGLALDVGSRKEASRFKELYKPMGFIKVGLELIGSGESEAVIDDILSAGGRVGLDIKLHDIPTTMAKAARAIAKRGLSFVTIHAKAGYQAVYEVQEAVNEVNAETGNNMLVVCVTRLTSDTEATDYDMLERADVARSAGAKALVCASTDLSILRGNDRTKDALTLVPGTRIPGNASHDQVRVTSQAEAIEAGADVLVIGRDATNADDPLAVVHGIAETIRPLLATSA